jgi:hypothetical protein
LRLTSSGSAVRVAHDFGVAPPWEAPADRAALSSSVVA